MSGEDSHQHDAVKESPADSQAIRLYDFGNATTLITHPSINMRQTVTGFLTGTWSAQPTSRTEFRIVDVHAMLVLPHLDVILPGGNSPERVHPGHVSLILGGFEVPEAWREIFGPINRGKIDLKHRVYHAVLGMYAQFSFAHRATAAKHEHMMLELVPAPIVLSTHGTIIDGGAMVAGGSGFVVDGWMQGAHIAASRCDPPPQTEPPRCGVLEPGTTWQCTRPQGHPLDANGHGHQNAYSGHTW